LDLALFIDAQNHGVIRGIEIEANNISDFFYKKGISGEFKMTLAMGLKTEGLPDPMDRGARELGFLGHGTDSPMGTILRFGLKGFTNQESYFVIRDGTGASWA